MVKYKIEGNINFYSELSNLLNKKEEEEISNLCLISNLPLTEHFIKLECGHSFNYLPLYKDIINHKQKYNYMELNCCILKTEQIRCPYCRNIQNNLLPYKELDGVEKIHGINYIDENYNKYNKTFIGTCSYKKLNLNFDENIDENQENNPKYIQCEKIYVNKLKENGLDYCCIHKNVVLFQITNEKKKMEKLKEKEAKEKAKLMAKQAKDEAKLLVKEANEKSKLLAKQAKLKAKLLEKVTNENLNNENTINNMLLCNAILKTGINKGTLCGKKIFENNKCKRHCNC
jgi:hypothetical protein